MLDWNAQRILILELKTNSSKNNNNKSESKNWHNNVKSSNVIIMLIAHKYKPCLWTAQTSTV